MKHFFTKASLCLSNRPFKLLVVFIFSLGMAISSYAHRVETYTTSGCFPGQAVTVDAVVVSAGGNTLYQWQFRDASGNWRCFINGTTTINGVQFTVSGATGGPVANDAPLLTISRADGNTSALDNVEVRVLMRDTPGPVCAATPIGHTLTGDTYGGDDAGQNETKYLRLHVYSFVGDCGGNTPGCIGNVLTSGGIYYGGFENKIYNAGGDNYTDNNFGANASSDFTPSFAEPTGDSYTAHSNTLTTTSHYLVANNPYYANFTYTRNIAPHTGNFQMLVNGSTNPASRAWFKSNITVVPGSTYSFCAWAAKVNGDNPNIGLNITAGATTTEIGNADLTSVAIGQWTEVCGTYTVPAGVTSITISIRDKNATGGANSYSLDDICFRLLGSIGNRVWNDTNKNGIQDAGEVGMAGVTVALFDANNVNLATTVTDANGNYLFTGLAVSAGGTNYQVRYSLPAEYRFSPQNSDAAGITGGNNSDADITTGRTGNITLTTATPNVSYVDAGVYYAVSARIGDFVWNDMNKDGKQDAGEPGLSGVSVMLYTTGDVLVAATITSNNGYYAFNDVAIGNYYIKVALPLGYQVSAKDQTADDKDSDIDPTTRKTPNFAVAANTFDLTFDAGLNVTPTTLGSASIGDRVWNDLDNDGTQDAGEPGIANVTVQLFNAANVLQATVTTDPFGYYVFNGLMAGNYYVKFTLPTGFTFTTANVGDDDFDSDPATGTGQTGTYILITDQIRTNVDAGMKRTASTAALGDFVWYDLNKDGVQNTGEAGAPGITVTLYNSSNAVVQTTTTDKTGFYLFTGLTASTPYTVGFSNLPAGYGFSPLSGAVTVTNNSDVNPSTGRTGTATTGAVGTSITYVDAGLIITPNTFDAKASIGDFVWNDLDNDGIQDANEPGVKNVIVTLYATDGTTVIATTTTDALGYYVFTNVDAGNYVIGFSGLPAGYVFATPNAPAATDATNSDAAAATGKTSGFSLKAGEVNLTIDAGVRNPTAGLLTIGDYVWYDVNGNGVQNGGEPGAEGISVELLDENSNTIATTTTNSKGAYLFTDLTAGTYYIQFSNLPAGFTATTKGAGTAANNSDAYAASLRTDGITLTTTSDLTWDLGIVSITKAALGDYVWNDTDADGVQDANENGIGGVTVTLYNVAGAPVASTVTDANGYYIFPNLDPATYTIGFSTIPANSGFTTKNSGSATTATDSDVNPATGKTDGVTLTAGQVNTTVDAGIISRIAAVGNYVWRDANVNGIQDATEKGAPGISVYLYTSTDATIGNVDDVPVASAVTDANGFYFMNNIVVAAGGSQFYIRFTDLQANNVFTTFNAAGSTAANNSDVTSAPATGGRTGFFTLLPGTINLDIDAGLVGPDNATLPVHQLELRSVLHGNTVDLSWIAENEMGTNLFVIQRSIDGINYSDIGSKLPAGPVNTPTEYKSTDDIQLLMSNAIIYYRIKATDINNKFAYSNIAPVKLNNLTGVQIWPNPFVSDIRISYFASVASTVEVRINDNAGRIVKQMNYAVSHGTNQLSINGIEHLSSGIYYINVTDKNTNQSFVQKLTK